MSDKDRMKVIERLALKATPETVEADIQEAERILEEIEEEDIKLAARGSIEALAMLQDGAA